VSIGEARAQLRRWQQAMLEELVATATPTSPSCLEPVAADLFGDLRAQYPRIVRDAVRRLFPLYAQIGEPLDETRIREAQPRHVETSPPAQVVATLHDLICAAAVGGGDAQADALLIDRARGLARCHPFDDGPAVAKQIAEHRQALARVAEAAEPRADFGKLFAVRLTTNLVELLDGLEIREATTVGWSRWFVFFGLGAGPLVHWVELADLRRAELHLAFAQRWTT
jgi:hypothetical protein